MSHPLRVRELKHEERWWAAVWGLSHPLRVRELKLFHIAIDPARHCVAPFTGAWIETPVFGRKESVHNRSHPLRVRELKHTTSNLLSSNNRRTLYGCVNWNGIQPRPNNKARVAPFTGAWIETFVLKPLTSSITSHPLRVRELKPWCDFTRYQATGRTLYGCVNWNSITRLSAIIYELSHPLRVRELKHKSSASEQNMW